MVGVCICAQTCQNYKVKHNLELVEECKVIVITEHSSGAGEVLQALCERFFSLHFPVRWPCRFW